VRHRRLFIYKPGTALIVADRVRSGHAHHYIRRFQLGPDLRIRRRGRPALSLRAGAFHGSLYSESSQGREGRSEVRGWKHPLAGLTSPFFRHWTPRWTVNYQSHARNAVYVTTLGLGPGQVRA